MTRHPAAPAQSVFPKRESSSETPPSNQPVSGSRHGSDRSEMPIRFAHDAVLERWFDHSSAERVSTDVTMVRALRAQYPQLELTATMAAYCDLAGYASAGHAIMRPVQSNPAARDAPLSWKIYVPPARRSDHAGLQGALVDKIMFAKYSYLWKEHDFMLYIVDGRDGMSAFPARVMLYLVFPPAARPVANELLRAAGLWSSELHKQIWVFDGGYWQKSAELWNSIQNADWSNVILQEDMKRALQADVEGFFDAQETYRRLQVPWKRGIIYHGPPGNGKTISIKATMHALYRRRSPVPSLYVRSFSSFAGPEASIKSIFAQARREAPCFLIFEDLDAVITDNVRSYFLNEIDGLQANDGILIVASTNHLDRLDPGIAKRPSRFDRLFRFDNPTHELRVQYSHVWQHKLADNPSIEFPDRLCDAIADITDDFSFAYLQEAFVAALLAIARDGESDRLNSHGVKDAGCDVHQHSSHGLIDHDSPSDSHQDLDWLVLWRHIKHEVAILRRSLQDNTQHT